MPEGVMKKISEKRNMELIEKIRAEIDRRVKELENDKYINIDAKVCRQSELGYLERFLDTLQEPKFDLDRLREVAVPLSEEEKEAYRKMMDERRKKYEEMGILQKPKVEYIRKDTLLEWLHEQEEHGGPATTIQHIINRVKTL